jgi:hypothetical protein
MADTKNPICRKRLFIDKKKSSKQKEELIKWAALNEYNTLVFSLAENINPKHNFFKLARRYNLTIETGGNDLSLLLPRRLFMFHRDLFRMEQGRRKKDHHFCPTNHKTTAIIKENAQILFSRFLQVVTPPRIFHLYPDKGNESTWCACPACRAFSPAEQYIIAVNTAADILVELDPKARLAYVDAGSEQGKESGIKPRKNLIKS